MPLMELLFGRKKSKKPYNIDEALERLKKEHDSLLIRCRVCRRIAYRNKNAPDQTVCSACEK